MCIDYPLEILLKITLGSMQLEMKFTWYKFFYKISSVIIYSDEHYICRLICFWLHKSLV
ncbi:hypothetical protein HanOQP8_Chr04g0146941 [Helianthus annuus]|nr:hypothetical protein HanOQP8_Chr04g0146941 [Helianthus annuus]